MVITTPPIRQIYLFSPALCTLLLLYIIIFTRRACCILLQLGFQIKNAILFCSSRSFHRPELVLLLLLDCIFIFISSCDLSGFVYSPHCTSCWLVGWHGLSRLILILFWILAEESKEIWSINQSGRAFVLRTYHHHFVSLLLHLLVLDALKFEPQFIKALLVVNGKTHSRWRFGINFTPVVVVRIDFGLSKVEIWK